MVLFLFSNNSFFHKYVINILVIKKFYGGKVILNSLIYTVWINVRVRARTLVGLVFSWGHSRQSAEEEKTRLEEGENHRILSSIYDRYNLARDMY